MKLNQKCCMVANCAIKVGSYVRISGTEVHLRIPQAVTFDREGVSTTVIHQSCQKTYALAVHAEKLQVLQFLSLLMPYTVKTNFHFYCSGYYT
jgi:hypothetical protein